MNDVYLASEIQPDSIVDGKGLRAVIWFQGCSHNCLGCHNPSTHKFNTGKKLKTNEVFKLIDELSFQDGITISGGDPFFQPLAFLEILKYSKEKEFNIWVYTGFTFEELLNMDDIHKEILTFIDVLVDGKFVLEEKDLTLKYKGSKNQRVIDVKKSLKSKDIVLYEANKVFVEV